MEVLVIKGADVATGFRFDVSAAIGLLISGAVTIAFARDCFGRSRIAITAAVLVVAVNFALACVASPIAFVALWQLQWFLLWGLSLFFGDDDAQAWAGRLLMTGWLVDSVLIAGAVAVAAAGVGDDVTTAHTIFTWGCVLSLANRCAALPSGAHALWTERPLRPAIGWMLIAILPPVTILGLGLVEFVDADPASRLGMSQFLGAVALTAGLTSLRQESAIRETAWRISAALAGVAAISLWLPLWPARALWIVSTVAAVILGRRRLSDAVPDRRQFTTTNDFLGRLETTAAREWNLPRLWRFGVAMPLRGAAQVLRFVDGFVFEQLPAQAAVRLTAYTSPVARAVPELFGSLLVPLLLAAAWIVLLALAFR